MTSPVGMVRDLWRHHRGAEPLSLAENTLWNAVGSVFYQGCVWVITVLVVVLSQGDYGAGGALAYAMTIGTVFTPLATYGIRPVQVSDVHDEYSLSNYVGFRLVTMTCAAVLSLAYATLTTADPALLPTVICFLAFKADEAFSTVLYAAEQKAGRMDYVGISQVLRGICVVGGFAGTLLLGGSLLVALLVMAGLCLCVTLFYDLPHTRRFAPVRPLISREQALTLARTCLPVVSATLVSGLIVSVVRQYFGNAYGEEALGYYASVATPSVIVQVLAEYLYAPALTPLAEKWSDGAPGEFTRFMLKIFALVVDVAGAAVLALSLAGGPLLTRLYGLSIEPYVHLLPMVLVGTSLTALLWYFMDVLVAIRHFGDQLVACLLALAVSAGTMVPFTATFYMDGVNFAICAGLGTGVAFAFWRVVALTRAHEAGRA